MDNLIKLATPKEKKCIEDCQHFALLYRYRNCLIHEYRFAGGVSEHWRDKEEPFYYCRRQKKDDGTWQDEWLLCYPLGFFF